MAKIKELKSMADKLRIESLKSTTAAGSGHPTSFMSCAEIMRSLFFLKQKLKMNLKEGDNITKYDVVVIGSGSGGEIGYIGQGMHIHPALPELILRTFGNLKEP